MTKYFVTLYEGSPLTPLYSCYVGDLSDKWEIYEHKMIDCFVVACQKKTGILINTQQKSNGYNLEHADEISNSPAHDGAKKKFDEGFQRFCDDCSKLSESGFRDNSRFTNKIISNMLSFQETADKLRTPPGLRKDIKRKSNLVENVNSNVSDGTQANVHGEKLLKTVENSIAVLERIEQKIPTGKTELCKHSPDEVNAKIIKACKLAIKNPRLTNVELAKLVELSKNTMEKHAKTVKRARDTGVCPKDTPHENKRSNRKTKGSDINKRNRFSADYEGGQ